MPPRATATPTQGFATPPAPASQRGRTPGPYVALNRVDKPTGPQAAPMNSPPPTQDRDPSRTYSRMCSRNYSQYRSYKRHCVLDHHRRYDHRFNRCVEFKSEEEFQTACLKCKEAQQSGQKRRDGRSGDGSPPFRSAPPIDCLSPRQIVTSVGIFC